MATKKKDEYVPTVVGNKVVVTRTIVEEIELEEFLRMEHQLNEKKEQMKNRLKEERLSQLRNDFIKATEEELEHVNFLIKSISSVSSEVKVLREKEIEEGKEAAEKEKLKQEGV